MIDLRDAPPSWTTDTVFERFESRTNLERTQPQLRLYRLERMETLLRSLGEPDRGIPTVHIAGSKGKGSTTAYIASLLAASGYTVGLYTSPHVRGYRERFTVVPPGYAVGDDRDIPIDSDARRIIEGGDLYEETLRRAGYRVWRYVEELIDAHCREDDLPTTFELLTALAFVFFPAIGCDFLVLETGLGGRLDATNVCDPSICGITRIEREHTDYLGETIPEIAAEKAGIIKRGVPIVTADQSPEALSMIEKTARERSAPLITVPAHLDQTPTPTKPNSWSRSITVAFPGGTAEVHPAMIGTVQHKNIAQSVALFTRLVADRVVIPAPPKTLAEALDRCRLPGRGEAIDDLFLDGAHTPESVAAVVESYIYRFGEEIDIPVILGIVAGKDIEGIAEALRPITSSVFVSRPGRFKPGDPRDVASRIASKISEVRLVLDPAEALAGARERRREIQRRTAGGTPVPPILVTGSFYMVAEIRRLVVR